MTLVHDTSTPEFPSAYYLPSSRRFPMAELKFGDVRLPYPVLDAKGLAAVIDELRENQRRYLASMPIFRIVQVLDEVVRRWRDPDYWLRREALRLLPTITRYSPQMVAAGLEWLNGFDGRALRVALRDEVGDPFFLDGFRPRTHGGQARAFGPEVSAHVFSGNVPGVCTLSLVSGLLTKSACLGKAATEEPLFPSLLARSIAEVSPELGRCLAMLYWKGGTTELEDVAYTKSDAVLAYGGNESIEAIRRRVGAEVPFIGYGHKIGFQIIAREALTKAGARDLARRAAIDVSFYDQQGCLSPHVTYLERGGEVGPKDFVALFAEEMEAFNRQIPRGPLSPDESIAINSIRETYEFKSMADDDVAVLTSKPGTDWTVILDSDPSFEPSCNNRVVRVKPVEHLEDVVDLVTPHRHFLQTIGAEGPTERVAPIAGRLGRLGANRICPVGMMGRPPYSWHHDGRFNFAELLRWVDLD